MIQRTRRLRFGEESLHPQLFYCNPQNWIVSFLIEIQFSTQIIRLFTMYIANLLFKVYWISLLCILPTQDDICPLQPLPRRGCSRKLFIKIERVFRSLGPVQIKAGFRLICVKQWSSSLMSTNWQENDFGRTIAIITVRGKKNKCSKDRTDWFYIYRESSISTYCEMLYHWFLYFSNIYSYLYRRSFHKYKQTLFYWISNLCKKYSIRFTGKIWTLVENKL